MIRVDDIILQVREAKTLKQKQAILETYKDDKILQTIIEYTYNPYKKYGISKSVFQKMKQTSVPDGTEMFYNLLDILASSNINNELRQRTVNYVKFFPEKIQDIMIGVITKDLKLGIGITTLNKVWPGLIPTFELQLAARFQKCPLDDNEYIYVTEKLDGIRCVCIVSEGTVKFFTRQGKEISGLIEIEDSVKHMGLCETVIDGELLFNGDYIDSGDQYKQTTKIVNSKMENKTQITFNMFDILPLSEFKKGESTKIYSERRKQLESLYQTNTAKVLPLLYEGTDHSQIMEMHKKMAENNREGVMVNRNHVYQCTRTKSLLKVKVMNDVDLKVVGYEEGRGENEGKLGAFIVDYKGNHVNVGSGFSKTQREEFWKNKDMFIGRIIKVQYFEESNNQQGGLSLRFPVFIEIRADKTEPSYE